MKSWFFKAVSISTAVRLTSAALLLAISVLLARVLGPQGFGAYTFAFTIISLAVLLAQLGFPELTVREVSRCLALGRRRLLAGYLRLAWLAIGAGGLVITSLTVALLLIFGNRQLESWHAILFGLPIILLFPLLAQAGAVIRGSGRVVQSILGQQLYRPGAFLLLLSIWLIVGIPVSPVSAITLMVIGSCVILIEQVFRAVRSVPELGRPARVSSQRIKLWSSSAIMFSGVAGVQLINAKFDVIALGYLTEEVQVGLYAVGVQLSQAAAVILASAIVVVMPGISRAYANGDDILTERLCRQAAQISLAGALAALAGGFLVGEWIIGTVYGPEYEPVWPALIILIFGQVVNAFFGPVAVLLNMRGEERSTLVFTGIASIVNVALNLALIPSLGLTGAAISTALSMAIWNFLLWNRAWSLWRLNSSALPFRVRV